MPYSIVPYFIDECCSCHAMVQYVSIGKLMIYTFLLLVANIEFNFSQCSSDQKTPLKILQ